MDGMNQNGNNPYGQTNGGYPQGDPYQANGGYPQNDPYYHNPYQPQGYQTQNGFGTQPVQPYDPGRNKGTGKKITVGILCSLVALIGIGIGAFSYYRSTPSYKINRGFLNLAKEIKDSSNPLTEKLGLSDIAEMMRKEGSHVESSLDFTLCHFLPYINETTLGVDTDFYKDVHEKQMSAETSLSLMNYDFAHLNLYADGEVFCFSLPELFLENMYIENENVVSQYNDSVLASGSPLDMEDFSIDLFSGQDGQDPLRAFRYWFEETGPELEALRRAMTIEKAEKGVYRVTFPQKESDRLLKRVVDVEDYGAMSAAQLYDLKSYKELVLSDVCLLIEIGKGNRIESIVSEEPVVMLDGAGSLDVEYFFLGEERSIDKMQGKLTAYADDDPPLAVVWQIQQTADDETYLVDMDMKMNEGSETTDKIKLVFDCDAVEDTVSLDCSVKDERSELQLVVEGSIDDYAAGESVEFSLDRAALSMDGEDLLRLAGEISVEPLREEIQPSVRPETAFFEMSESDWYDILWQFGYEYGDLLDSLLW